MGMSVPGLEHSPPSRAARPPNQGAPPQNWFRRKNISRHWAISFRKWSFRKSFYTSTSKACCTFSQAGSLPLFCKQSRSEENNLFLKQRINDHGRKSRYPKGNHRPLKEWVRFVGSNMTRSKVWSLLTQCDRSLVKTGKAQNNLCVRRALLLSLAGDRLCTEIFNCLLR